MRNQRSVLQEAVQSRSFATERHPHQHHAVTHDVALVEPEIEKQSRSPMYWRSIAQGKKW
jgi:hypothetical protein